MASISQAQASKEEMEREILQAITKFEKETELTVASLDIISGALNTGTIPNRVVCVETTVEL